MINNCKNFDCCYQESCMYAPYCEHGKKLCPLTSCGVECSVCRFRDECRKNNHKYFKQK